MTAQAAQSPVKNRIFLVSLIALFVIPVAASWLLVGQWRPAGTVNYGQLLDPAQPVSHLQAQRLDGTELGRLYLQGHWTLTYPGKAGCNEPCEQGLYNIRQVHIALGKNAHRAQTLLLLDDTPSAQVVDWLAQEHGNTTAAVADEQTLDFFTQAFPGEAAALGEWIYLIDPLGNLFMRYQIEDDPKGILEDLERLLKYSKIG